MTPVAKRTRQEMRVGAAAAKRAGKEFKRFLKKVKIQTLVDGTLEELPEDRPRTPLVQPPAGDCAADGSPLIPKQVQAQAAAADRYFAKTYADVLAGLKSYEAQLLVNLLEAGPEEHTLHKSRFEVAHAIVTHLKNFNF
jgi:hypothetical protein